ncbi:MAG: hypothetical protein KJ043_18115, partial [Anaerolineae bacterium]|nr:hypothetical protein [Anaerolineae bacterium]
VFLLMLLITGCAQIAPAQLPERLADQSNNQLPTLSAPFTITENTYQNEVFSVTYPEGWRVVSSASFAPPSAVFVSPDERQIILISTEDNPSLTYPFDDVEYDNIQTQQGDIWIIGIAPVAEWDAFLGIYEAMIAGLGN